MGRIDHEARPEKIKLDKRDKRILTLLSHDARMPLTQIAKQVRLSRDAVDYRIKRMEKEGIILQFFPNLDFERLGYFVFHIFFLIDELDAGEQKKFLAFLKKHPHIYTIIEYSDRWDLEVTILARNLLEFDRIMLEITSSFPHIILEKDKVEIIRRYNVGFLPPLLPETKHTMEDIRHVQHPKVDVDEMDIKILQELSKDCRQSTYVIGKNVGLSADAVGYRMKSLVKEGVIKHFTILVNFSKLRYYWYTYTMELKVLDHENEVKFQGFLDTHKNVLRSAKTLGGWDLLLYIVVENPREFHTIIKELKNVFSSVVRNYQTWIAYKEHQFQPMPGCISDR